MQGTKGPIQILGPPEPFKSFLSEQSDAHFGVAGCGAWEVFIFVSDPKCLLSEYRKQSKTRISPKKEITSKHQFQNFISSRTFC